MVAGARARTVDIALSPSEAADSVLVRRAAEEAAGLPVDSAVASRILKRSIDASKPDAAHPPPRRWCRTSHSPPADVPRQALPDVHGAPTGDRRGLRAGRPLRGAPCHRPRAAPRAPGAGERRARSAPRSGRHPPGSTRWTPTATTRSARAAPARTATASSTRGATSAATWRASSARSWRTARHPTSSSTPTRTSAPTSCPGIITAMREAIVASGGEVRFGARVTDLVVEGARVRGAVTADGGSSPPTR
jgi:phytoene dehydrogenase-like protein